MLNGKNILITGGTGSFGKRCVDILIDRCRPSKLIVFSRDELKQHEMKTGGYDHPSLRYFIGDVRDKDRLKRAMAGVDIVIHAAALKQVPVCEYNPFEAVKTNILGAQNIIDTAIDCGVNQVIALSTDKAVNPVNLYGATKLCAEKIFIQGNVYSKKQSARFSCVRYGNVIGSRGSVIPLFLKQRTTGKITVTDPRMTRFWITLDEAVELVLKGLRHMQGGEIFVPKIPSMKITDLAKAVAPDCEVEFIGIRPGEKLHEVLTTEEEGRSTLDYEGMFVITPHREWWKQRNYKTATPVPEGFVYASNNHRHILGVDELKQILHAELEDRRPFEIKREAPTPNKTNQQRTSTPQLPARAPLRRHEDVTRCTT